MNHGFTAEHVERVGSKLFDIVLQMISDDRASVNPAELLAQAVREAGLR